MRHTKAGWPTKNLKASPRSSRVAIIKDARGQTHTSLLQIQTPSVTKARGPTGGISTPTTTVALAPSPTTRPATTTCLMVKLTGVRSAGWHTVLLVTAQLVPRRWSEGHQVSTAKKITMLRVSPQALSEETDPHHQLPGLYLISPSPMRTILPFQTEDTCSQWSKINWKGLNASHGRLAFRHT